MVPLLMVTVMRGTLLGSAFLRRAARCWTALRRGGHDGGRECNGKTARDREQGFQARFVHFICSKYSKTPTHSRLVKGQTPYTGSFTRGLWLQVVLVRNILF